MSKKLTSLRISHQFGHVVIELELEVLLLVGLEEADVDLLGDDLRADVVLDGEAEPHLLQNELHLLPPLHRSTGLNLSKTGLWLRILLTSNPTRSDLSVGNMHQPNYEPGVPAWSLRRW